MVLPIYAAADLDGNWVTNAAQFGNGTYTVTMKEFDSTDTGFQHPLSKTSNGQTFTVALADLPQSQLHKVAVGAVDLLIQRRADEGVIVWPGACPHEGSDLSRAKLCGQDIQCHWHGLRFVGTILTPAQHTGSVGALEVRLEGTELVVSQHGSAQGTEADIVSGL